MSQEQPMAVDGVSPAKSDGQGSAGAAAWAESEPAPCDEDLRKLKMSTFTAIAGVCKTYGTPKLYLEKELGTMQKRQRFGEWLWQLFPESDQVFYSHDKELPSVPESEVGSELPHNVHVLALGFDSECSVKPPAGQNVVMKIMEQILLEGFVTSGEPLLVSQPPELLSVGPEAPWGSGLPTMSLGYIKGQARATTMLCILHYFYTQQIDLKNTHPKLYDSLLKIQVLKINYANKIEEGLANMKLSARGSIRKANNVIQTVLMLQRLSKHGLTDPGSFVRRW